jgi:sensor c-di-GMP phosphodiesterase-like protein
MRAHWKKAVMIMLMGLLVAGPFTQIHNAAAQGENPQMAAQAAKAMNDKAATQLHQLMMQMDSMSKMPMSDNEKAMMKMMHQMAQVIQMLIDANNHLIAAMMEHKN